MPAWCRSCSCGGQPADRSVGAGFTRLWLILQKWVYLLIFSAVLQAVFNQTIAASGAGVGSFAIGNWYDVREVAACTAITDIGSEVVALLLGII